MLQALALAAAIAASPPAPSNGRSASASTVATSSVKAGCAAMAMDPSFVRYVPPATRSGSNPLLWLIGSGPAPTPAVNAFAARPLLDCLNPLLVRNDH